MTTHDSEPVPLEGPAPGPGAAPAETGAAAIALALARDRTGGSDAKLDAFLDEQTRFLRLQSENLHEQRALQIEHLKQQEKHLRLRFFGDRLRIGLQLLGIVAGLAVVSFLGALAWNAHEDHGVSIAAFSVPPDLAQRGLTGQVVASQLLDQLAELQKRTATSRPASSYANDWGGDIKVEIPETGVSIGELNRYLRQWLGAETRITGEIVRTSSGVAVTARAGDEPGRRFEGAESDLDKLIGQAAEAVYQQTQPYRYAVWLASTGQADAALAAYKRLARSGSKEDQQWAYTGWATALLAKGDDAGTVAVIREAERRGLDVHETGGGAALALAENDLGHFEEELTDIRNGLRQDRSARLHTIFVGPAARRVQEATIATLLGDHRTGAAQIGGVGDLSLEGGGPVRQLMSAILEQILDHDVSGGRRGFELLVQRDPSAEPARVAVDLYAAQVLDDGPGLIAAAERVQKASPVSGPLTIRAWPMLALGYALAGRQADAEALLATTPLDCDRCLEARGRVAAVRRDWVGAAHWFSLLDQQAPESPNWDAEWGEALLAEGDLDGAIAKLAEAHRKSPHYADPVELWGEALMRKGDFAGAVAKFAAADKEAPRWGRNHLRWGEALLRSGRYAEARAQFEAANGMDLSRPDRAALDVFLARTARGPLHG
jgi:tetratricopeptide (TPR) repeat protein